MLVAGSKEHAAEQACFIHHSHGFGRPAAAREPDGFLRAQVCWSLQAMLVELDIAAVDKAQRALRLCAHPTPERVP
jgi:hypothetical protein